METVFAVSIGVLAIVFIGSLIALVLVCKHRYDRKVPFSHKCFNNNKSNATMINEDTLHEVELNDVGIYPELDAILANDQWVNDSTGVIPHCIAILRTCHHLTERLVAMTIGNVSPNAQQRSSEIIDAARRISPCVDDVVRSMYPPIDARLLEARSSVLILSVRYLALVTSSICEMPLAAKWISEKLMDMEEHLQILREAGLSVDATMKLQSYSSTSENIQTVVGNPNADV